jgi:Probable cobalt transporter subunit (CbtB)
MNWTKMSSRTRILLTGDMDVSPRIAVGILLGILIIGIFVIGYDQGHLFSIVQGQEAFDTKWMHEFYHDTRHASGFPCH